MRAERCRPKNVFKFWHDSRTIALWQYYELQDDRETAIRPAEPWNHQTTQTILQIFRRIIVRNTTYKCINPGERLIFRPSPPLQLHPYHTSREAVIEVEEKPWCRFALSKRVLAAPSWNFNFVSICLSSFGTASVLEAVRKLFLVPLPLLFFKADQILMPSPTRDVRVPQWHVKVCSNEGPRLFQGEIFTK